MQLKIHLRKNITTTREILNIKSIWNVPNFQNIWSLKNQGITPVVKWRIVKKVNNKVSLNNCKLCLMEKIFVIKSLEDCNLLNKRSELVRKYRYQNKLLLCNWKRNDSMDRCLWLYFVFIFNIFCLFIFRQHSENGYMNHTWWMQQH